MPYKKQKLIMNTKKKLQKLKSNINETSGEIAWKIMSMLLKNSPLIDSG